VQIAFWLMFTHLKSRFLLPTSVPLCVLAALGIHATCSGASQPRARGLASAMLFLPLAALASVNVWIYRSERGGAPALAIGAVADQTGEGLLPSQREELGRTLFPSIAVNWLLPKDSRVLLVGDAAPLYMQLDRITYNTVWDRGPLSTIIRQQPDDPEAWRAALVNWNNAGFTHMLVNPAMLDRWQQSGWNDPLITRHTVIDFAERACEPLYDYPNDITLYAIPQ
jgi:hypothetical protein